MKIEVNRSTQLGKAGTVSITLSEDKDVSRETVAVVFATLIQAADDMLHMYTEALGVRNVFNDQTPGSETRTIAVSGISVEMKDGKKLYKVKSVSEEFKKFGINFWPEHMKQCDIDPRAIPDEGYEFKQPTNAIIEYVGGKPKRVLRLEKINAK